MKSLHESWAMKEYLSFIQLSPSLSEFRIIFDHHTLSSCVLCNNFSNKSRRSSKLPSISKYTLPISSYLNKFAITKWLIVTFHPSWLWLVFLQSGLLLLVYRNQLGILGTLLALIPSLPYWLRHIIKPQRFQFLHLLHSIMSRTDLIYLKWSISKIVNVSHLPQCLAQSNSSQKCSFTTQMTVNEYNWNRRAFLFSFCYASTNRSYYPAW